MSGQWLPDPEGRYEYRWHDGQNWTDQVSHQGQLGRAPLGSSPPPPQRAGDGFAGITGDLIDGRFSEKESLAILARPEMREKLSKAGFLVQARTGQAHMARVAKEVPMFRDIITTAGIKVQGG